MAGNGAPSASDAALADLLGAQQQQLAHLSQQITQFQVQNRQQTTHIRQIPLIPKLSRAEDLQTWRGMLVMVLYDFNLLEYLVGPDIPEPKDPAARRSWLIDRLDLDEYIQATVSDPEIWNTLRTFGWSAKDTDPKKTFNLVIRYFERGALETSFDMHHELVTARCEAFDSLASFLTRITYLKERLEDTDFRMNEKTYTCLALKGIASKYPDICTRWVPHMEAVTWGELMGELWAQADGENDEANSPMPVPGRTSGQKRPRRE